MRSREDFAVETATLDTVRHQLVDRRRRLQEAVSRVGSAEDLVSLLQQVDSALGRLDTEDYGLCLVCKEHVGDEELVVNPLAQYCLCDLTREQQRALEHDLELARRIQSALLPDPDVRAAGWQAHYRYEPAGPVSGDYCDLWVAPEGDDLYFLVGDVSGKGVSAALLMAHLHASIRSRLEMRPPIAELIERANQLLLQSTLTSHYATLVCGRAASNGRVELVNAGHCPPLVVRGEKVETVESTGFPLGLMNDRPYELRELVLDPGDKLLLYTDGLSEARRADGTEYGTERVARLISERNGLAPRELIAACRADLDGFLAGASRADDLSLMMLRRGA